ncbi:DgyrCDS13847 [Dimorphilus gyrociliatus]|uniref:DgyrCDS13847 n=1 Tax=Dimorphilus gyrociliatus TaxID=2664684 RepID=A0A7I8WBV5_9ANNE|nr:DgyrCDS13847 [Dimorphilus gyrociliatus]
MHRINSAIVWYQQQIGAYDKQLWERSVEQSVIKSIQEIYNAPKRLTKVKSELIDVDLVRGSTFSKAKPQHGWFSITKNAMLHLMLLPLYYNWWKKQTSAWFTKLLVFLYILQLSAFIIFFTDENGTTNKESLSLAHLLTPFILMIILTISHARIIATGSQTHLLTFRNERGNNSSRPRMRRKQKKKRPKTTQNHELKSPHFDTSDKDSTGSVGRRRRSGADSETSGILVGKEETDEDGVKETTGSLQACVPNDYVNFPGDEICGLTDEKDITEPVGVLVEDDENLDVVPEIKSVKNKLNLNLDNNSDGLRKRKKCDFDKPVVNRSDVESSCESEIDTNASNGTTPLYAKSKKLLREPSTDNEACYNKLLCNFNQIFPKIKPMANKQEEKCQKDSSTTDPQTSDMDWNDSMNAADSTTASYPTASEVEASEVEQEGLPGKHVASVLKTLGSNCDKVGCYFWEGEEVRKIDMSAIDIGWHIIEKVDNASSTNSTDYLAIGTFFSVCVGCIPVIYRGLLLWDKLEWNISFKILLKSLSVIFGADWRTLLIIVNGVMQRLVLSSIFFFLLSVAERTFKQRLLDAKYFCYLTSSRRSKQHGIPHMRLNKVKNIKCWLSLRSYLKRRGPQRSVDTIVSAAFLLAIAFFSILCVKLLENTERFLTHLGNWEVAAWCIALAIFLLRFIILASKINQKYRNFSLLITEQINLYLHMEQKPHKKDELMLAHNVLKLAESLLKELESPFKISGFSASPFLYNITKVIILSALSAVLSDQLGFKPKLHRIKLS